MLKSFLFAFIMRVLYVIRFPTLRGKRNRYMKYAVIQEEKNLLILGCVVTCLSYCRNVTPSQEWQDFQNCQVSTWDNRVIYLNIASVIAQGCGQAGSFWGFKGLKVMRRSRKDWRRWKLKHKLSMYKGVVVREC